MHECPIELGNGARSFPDPVPRGLQAVAARKVSVEDSEGCMERLEFDRGLGRFETYYTMPLRRHRGRHDRA